MGVTIGQLASAVLCEVQCGVAILLYVSVSPIP